jgi:hypothetical protein
MLKRFVNLFSAAAVSIAILGGCASSQMKARKEQRDKAAQSSKLYCDFVNGELYPDVEVMVNLEMAKRCDSDKAFSVTNYKTSNENMGIVFCCALRDEKESKEAQKSMARSEVTSSQPPPPPPANVRKEAPPTTGVTPAAPPVAPPAKAPEKSSKPEAPVDELGD